MKNLICAFAMAVTTSLHGQDTSLPYYEIPTYPEGFTAGTVASRMLDGLGFRYYWATEGLRSEDLSHKPSKDARSSEETVAHIYEMSTLILNATTKTPNVPGQAKQLPFAEMRKVTLHNFKNASTNLRKATNEQMKEFKFIYKDQNQTVEYPFWNMINGPIEDCVWHVGQLVSFRRSSGNPFNGNAEVFTGKLQK
ncbi:MAG TPA: hypothetical protein VL728_03685 [Cyclobacteriaceae bacterium]|jgi:hypothetical protein|nr:hypothetical protein [Cyclobacteriaceae bacterium]